MFITNDWAFVHFPKMAGSWIVDALGAACREEGVPHFYYKAHVERWRAATFYVRDIPILGSIRHPCDWYVSKYEYRHWVQYQREGSPMGTEPMKLGPMSFHEYLQYAVRGQDWSEMLYGEDAEERHGLWWMRDRGWLTTYFYYWFSLPPWQPDETPLLKPHRWGLVPEDIAVFKRAFENVTFLRLEYMPEILCLWLGRQGFGSRAQLAARIVPKLNVTVNRKQQPWREYYSDEDLELVRHRERLLFELFPEYLEAM